MTQDNLPNWFANDGLANFERILKPEFQGKSARYLQVGSYAGDASLWLYENLIQGTDSVLVDVDTWEGSDEVAHKELNWGTVEDVYDAKTSAGRFDRKILKLKGTSDSFFKNNRELYDFVYVDGDHTAYGVIKDAVNAFECTKTDGIIAFDDYSWTGGNGPADRPRMAIDAFLEIYKDKVEVIIKQYQCWVRKVA
jgi:predicted O-methyltransferase YrrM